MGQTRKERCLDEDTVSHIDDSYSTTSTNTTFTPCEKNELKNKSNKTTFWTFCRRLLQWLSQVKKVKVSKVQHSRITDKKIQITSMSSPKTSISTHNTYPQTDDDDVESGFEDDDDSDNDDRLSPTDVSEWSIPSGDLQFDTLLTRGRFSNTYRGRWHGEVLIHTYTPRHESHVQRFISQVTALSMIRHENVALFMGACVEPSVLAIVMSMRSGPSICEFVHARQESISLSDKINIAQQIAQAMGYIHAKGIVHGCLSSRNVFLEGRVQVSLLDHDLPDSCLDRKNACYFPRGQITYFSPELMCSLQLIPPHVVIQTTRTRHSDVYAFGTLLYELMTKQWPMQGEDAHSIIWRVSTGKGPSLENTKAPSTIKDLLSMCWSFEREHRPNFSQIVHHLQRSVSLHRRYSSSEPERLNRIDQKLAC